METRVSRAMERSKKNIKPSALKAQASNRHNREDEGRGMGGTAEEGNKETAWKPVMFGINAKNNLARVDECGAARV